jgi:hypothetical protein
MFFTPRLKVSTKKFRTIGREVRGQRSEVRGQSDAGLEYIRVRRAIVVG